MSPKNRQKISQKQALPKTWQKFLSQVHQEQWNIKRTVPALQPNKKKKSTTGGDKETYFSLFGLQINKIKKYTSALLYIEKCKPKSSLALSLESVTTKFNIFASEKSRNILSSKIALKIFVRVNLSKSQLINAAIEERQLSKFFLLFRNVKKIKINFFAQLR